MVSLDRLEQFLKFISRWDEKQLDNGLWSFCRYVVVYCSLSPSLPCLSIDYSPALQRDLTTGAGKGFGFVTYNEYNDAVSAIQAMNGYEFEKNGYKPLQVSFKTAKRK